MAFGKFISGFKTKKKIKGGYLVKRSEFNAKLKNTPNLKHTVKKKGDWYVKF